ncbi:MAG: GNAT family N-acetyltransferase [Pseudomonadota bacterium]
MTEPTIQVDVLSDLAEISPIAWDSCANPCGSGGGRPSDPFTTHRFLRALEVSGSVGAGTGWAPRHLVATLGDNVIGVAPMYLKSHSQGEYIFDHNWAHAYERAGGRYYPKLQIAVPFTPATGRRLLVRPGFEEVGRAALLKAASQLADENRISSVHITFCDPAEAEAAEAEGFLYRLTDQFHWEDQGYGDFDGFLSSLSSRKRKAIRKERRVGQDFGGKILSLRGEAIQPHHWDAFWRFYQDTGARKWGTPYLTRRFFDEAQAHLTEDILLVLAEREGRFIAGALNFIGARTLFGRYWGCIEHHPCLHFELCYYQAIEFALTNSLARVEAGAQGEHKLARGYLPSKCHSLHWIRDLGLRRAIAEYLVAEKTAVDREIEVLTEYGPFKRHSAEIET